MNKKLIFIHLSIIAFVGILVTGCSLPWQKEIQKQESAEQATVQMVILKITNKEAKTYEYPLVYQSNSTALDLFKWAGVPVEMKTYDFGSFVESISGVKGEQGRWWIYYLNGAAATMAADKYMVKPGDVVEWKYEEEREGL
ncbi:hypothetical protein A3I42_01780 [Candidatus Uhrbacteria bacterium RIFCSPLOWO2_02_FULL_49_11]|uniref:Transcobalamin-like C-terminal domain-containing protein n=1 Tax=Candidatus Uhrbacteria bacterium RIFCSPLOWO2_02_FULL_49_11 TaxID=1802409 RepID=A0A1F7VC29_9BACT|nr:MAG: hypothetical protein A3I42_01780 [Candidatus Uhrbacteria bacterium RIFCSPLOWO2_02_FULL_49_11]